LDGSILRRFKEQKKEVVALWKKCEEKVTKKKTTVRESQKKKHWSDDL
jgi:hypothetical protein